MRKLAVAIVTAAITVGCDGSPESSPPRPVIDEPVAQAAPDRGPVHPPVFEERAVEAGLSFRMGYIPNEQGANFKINLYDHGSGVAVADYDGDGRDDVLFLNQIGGNALFRNEGGGKFADVTAKVGADIALADRISVAAAFGDYDDDGRQDLHVTTTRGGNALFHNEGGGKFRDVTKEAGVALVAHSAGCAFFDADQDGDLDLLVLDTAKWTNDFDEKLRYFPGPSSLFDLQRREPERNVYWRNEGNGKFTDATEESGLAGHGWSCDAAVFDYDGDGAVDVFISNMFGASGLYRNNGHGRFTDLMRSDLERVPFGAVGARAFDYDLDGRLDLMVADMHSDMWVPADFDVKLVEEKRKYDAIYGPMVTLGKMTAAEGQALADIALVERKYLVFGNTLYRNLGKGSFADVSGPAGVETFQPWGVVPADFRNAGAEDVFVPSGMGWPFFFWRNNYLLNQLDTTFVENSKAAGLDPPPGGEFLEEPIGGQPATKGARSAATADFDGDGRVDLVVNNFRDRAHLYVNRTPPRSWIAFRLTGTKSNRDAIGALATVKVGRSLQVRQVQAAGGYLSQSSKTLHFGLGGAGGIDSVEIVWPSGVRQRMESPEIGRIHDVSEPDR